VISRAVALDTHFLIIWSWTPLVSSCQVDNQTDALKEAICDDIGEEHVTNE